MIVTKNIQNLAIISLVNVFVILISKVQNVNIKVFVLRENMAEIVSIIVIVMTNDYRVIIMMVIIVSVHLAAMEIIANKRFEFFFIFINYKMIYLIL